MKRRPPSNLTTSIKCITNILSLALLGVATATNALAAQSIAAEQVSNYELRPQTAETAETVTFAPVTGRYQTTPGSVLTLSNPFDNAAIDYAVVDGQTLELGTLIAQLNGPSVEHFFHRVDMLQEQYDVATKQYQSKKRLYENNAIAADEWQQFLTQYINLSDTMHDINVVLRRVTQTGEQSAQLIATESGIWRTSSNSQQLGSLLTQERLAVVVEIPMAQAKRITHLQINSRQLPVRQREQTVRNGFVRVWSESPGQVAWTIDQRFTVDPQAKLENAYRVPASAIATLQDQVVVFSMDNSTIKAVPVELLSLQNTHYFVQSATSLNRIATNSVAALKVITEEQEAQ
ncbi:membrane fusion-like protein [Idiomarina seosinensis]|uniref:Membrane fusion-like protein n=1 Tax=Idiomarina seosinensis TaxID=281739 RepID=A0A432ZDY2_9GAMM|nr:membrane fusion-like protein [Idiomarina seosinensis]RUO76173.1 membrane fusion-like protein [Idiomarina seosinensis]